MEDTKKELPLTALTRMYDAIKEVTMAFLLLCIISTGVIALFILFACRGDEIDDRLEITMSILFSVLLLATIWQLKIRISVLKSIGLAIAQNHCDDHLAHENERFEHALEIARLDKHH